MNRSNEAVIRALSAFAAHVGAAPRYATLMPAIMMPMHMAVDADAFSVTGADSRVFFLKVYAEDSLPFIDDADTAAASRAAAACGIGPAVVAHDTASAAILFDYLAPPGWRMASRRDLRSPDTLHAVLAAKRAWHRSPLLAHTANPFDRLRRHRARLEALTASTPPAYALLVAWADRFEQAILAAGVDTTPLHGENVVSNVMLSDSGVQLVDFDHAGNGDPFYDLGAFCLEFCSFEDEVEDAVTAYLGAPDRRAVARVRLYMIVDDLLWACWALIAQATSPRRKSIEFYKYAQNRFLRCQYWLGLGEVDALLRQL